MIMTSNEAHSGESPSEPTNSQTPIFDELMENWPAIYADDVLARKVDADINPPTEEDKTDDA